MDAERCDLLCLDLPRAEELRRRRLGDEAASVAAGRARALGDPTRLTIAAALHAGRELCVCDLAWIIGRPDALVSHHVRALRGGGLATSRRDGKLVMYSLTEDGAALLDAVLDQAVTVAP
jgi:DNA-binding transcriptional ArsR family regulator